MYGVNVYSELAFAGDPDIISLQVNNEIVINNVIWWEYNPQGATGNIFKPASYHPIKRPLDGSDTISMSWDAINAHKVYIVFHFADAI